MLLRLYTYYADSSTDGKTPDPESRLNGSALPNGHARSIPDASDRQIRDAEEFELEGLMSEDDEDLTKHHDGR
jgi:hypothetical protein